MPRAHVVVATPVARTPRVQQLEGLFDLPPSRQATLEWQVDLPLNDRPWNIGLVVGPSGSGKSTVVRALFGDQLAAQEHLPPWPSEQSLLDGFPEALSVKDIVALLSSVGFSSPPAWLRPFRVLSTGEQFRATLARLLAYAPDLAVMDEYTSVVDRTVAQVGSAALARTVRSRSQRFLAVTCHEDVEAWLQPDWVYRPAANLFTWRCLQGRPAISLVIQRTGRAAWKLFQHHHYLSNALAPGAVCFVAFWEGRPVAFSAWIAAFSRRPGKREHRTVCLPDYQGVGIGQALSNFCAALWKALGYRATSTTTHPAFIAARRRSPCWRMTRPPSLVRPGSHSTRRHATTRLTAGFEYLGPALDVREARKLVGQEG
jgi:GNAT superfamily N-acetyltransferase